MRVSRSADAKACARAVPHAPAPITPIVFIFFVPLFIWSSVIYSLRT
jgi:hypothetical protein